MGSFPHRRRRRLPMARGAASNRSVVMAFAATELLHGLGIDAKGLRLSASVTIASKFSVAVGREGRHAICQLVLISH